MAATIDDGLVLVTTEITHASVAHAANVTYAMFDDTGLTSAQAWADFCQTQFTTNWAAVLDNNASIVRTLTVKGDGTENFTTGESTAAPTVGGAALTCPPPNWAMLVQKKTGFGGRKNRGRMYMPWMVTEGDIGENGHFGGATLTARQAVADAWLADLNTSAPDAFMCLANREYDLPWDNPMRKLVHIEAGFGITALTVQGFGATQRRRQPRA